MILQDLRQNHGMDQKQLARLTSRSRSWVSRRLSMVERIDPEVAIDIRMGELTGSHGRALMKLPRGNQHQIARTIITWGLSTRQSDQVIQAWLDEPDTDKREYILEHPEVVFRQGWYDEDISFDARLSSFGNELHHCAGAVIRSLTDMHRLLSDARMEGLAVSETAILLSSLQRALRWCHLVVRDEAEVFHQLKQSKSIQEHEK